MCPIAPPQRWEEVGGRQGGRLRGGAAPASSRSQMKTPRARRMETQIPTKLLRETKLRGSCSRVGTVEGTGGARGPLGRPSRLVSCPCRCAPSTAPCGRGGKAARHSLPRACPRHLRADSWGGVPQFVHTPRCLGEPWQVSRRAGRGTRGQLASSSGEAWAPAQTGFCAQTFGVRVATPLSPVQ